MNWLALALWFLLGAPYHHADAQFYPLGLQGQSGGCSQATTFLARTTGLDATHTTAYTNLICGMVTAGLWTKMDAFYVLATSTATIADLNLVSTSFTLSPQGSPAFTADQGYTGVAVSNTVYIDTTYAPSTAGLQYTLNSAHMSVWSLTNASNGGGPDMGLQDASNSSSLYTEFSDGNSYAGLNAPSANRIIIAVTDSLGQYIINRSGSAAQQLYKNATSIGTNTGASAAISTGNAYLIGWYNAGIPQGTNHQQAAASFGASLTSTDVTNYYTLLHAYLHAVGAV